jgi:phytoene dehydrogenase-like protein
MGKNVIVVGGGICGLTAAIYLARGGRTVTLFEKRSTVGGRATTNRRHGYRFNLGPHALNRAGVGVKVLTELGVPADGGRPSLSGIALFRDHMDALPMTLWGLTTTGILSARAKLEAVALRLRIRRIRSFAAPDISIGEWLDRNVDDEALRRVMESLVRLATYSDAQREQSAAAVLRQLQIARRGVIYVHDGWQKLVNGLHSAAVGAGVNFVTRSRVVAVEHNDTVQGIEIGGLEEPIPLDTLSASLEQTLAEATGTRLRADIVLLALDPATAASMIGNGSPSPHALLWKQLTPVSIATLDVGLSVLPSPKKTFALGIDEPIYFSVHSAAAQLAPKGGSLIHVARYLERGTSSPRLEAPGDRETATRAGAASSLEADLEQVLDRLQPGWRDRVVHRRFLPNMTVSNALVSAAGGGLAGRPGVEVPGIRNLYVAGDWVGGEGMLSDAAFASARAAAKAILAKDN